MLPEEDRPQPILAHLAELRVRTIRALVAIIIGVAIAMFFADALLALLTAPVRTLLTDAPSHPLDAVWFSLSAWVPESLRPEPIPGTLAITTSPTEGVMVWFRVVLLGGVVLASPVIAREAWAFVAPGLYHTERKVVLPLALSSTFLFLVGALFAYAMMLPISLPFFLTVLQAEAVLSVEGYLNSTLQLLGAFGLTFQMPVLAYFLGRMGLISASDLWSSFRYAAVGIFFVAALLTPPDVITQILLALPLLLLYLVSIGVVWLTSTKR